MKYKILQHWTGELRELEELSRDTFQEYADWCGADYELVLGNQVSDQLAPQSQKMIALDERYDDYDVVVMVDLDMFIRKDMNTNIFTQETGIGRHFGIQKKLVRKLKAQHPLLGDTNYPYWGGSCYRLERCVRRKLRRHFNLIEAIQFNKTFHDEGIMHRLAVLAGMPIETNTYFEDDRWNKGSSEDGLEKANFIHIRPRIRIDSNEERPKIETYRILKEKEIIS